MKSPLRSLTLSLSGFLAFFPTLGFALNQPVMYEPNQAFPLTPRITGLGMVGDDELVWGDMMLPLAGNHNQVWHVDVQSKTAFDSDWLGSLGTGARKVFNDNSIWGAYVFVDRNVSPENNLFWFVSPGIEELGNWFDFRANGYFPTNTKKQYGSTDWADNFGVYDYVSFQGHTQYDILMTQDEEVGWGYDGEIGAKIPGLHGTRAYVGGYHFGFDSASDINGVEGRIELPVNRYIGVSVRDSYDNEQHNTFLVGLKVTLGGVNAHPSNPQQAIQERILDPIERNLATLGQGVGEPVQDVLTPVPVPTTPSTPDNPNPPPPPPMIERDNIWYFSATGTDTFTGSIDDCTFENVCVDSNFNQDTVDGINALKLSSPEINNFLDSSPSFYLAPGTYSSLNEDGTGPLVLTNDWIWGKSANFVNEELRTLTGAMSFYGGNNRLNTILLQSDGNQDVGIILNPDSFLKIENSQIGSPSNAAGATYHTAIEANNASLEITDFLGAGGSEIRAYGNDGQPVIGIDSTNSSISIRNSDVFATAEFTATDTPSFAQSAIALSLTGSPLVTISDSTILAQATWNGILAADFSNMATGIFSNTSRIVITNSTVEADATVTANNSGNNLASAIGANGVDDSVSFKTNNITISGNTSFINANAIVEGGLSGVNAATGIGENLVDASAAEAPFSDNIFMINTGSHINSTASVVAGVGGSNLSTGIGNNGVGATNALTQNNEFTLNSVEVESLAEADSTVELLGFNMAAGIGGNATSVADATFDDNKIIVENISTINATAQINTNLGVNFAVGLGGNAASGATSNFSNNKNISVSSSKIVVKAEAGTNGSDSNSAAGIGGNAHTDSNANFNNNIIISITNASNISGTAIVDSGASVNNTATGIGGNAVGVDNIHANFDGNTSIVITDSIVGAVTQITSSLSLISTHNLATGLGGNAAGFSATTANFNNNTINISGSSLSGSATIITGGRALFNYATGLGGNINPFSDANFTSNSITINDSTLQATASEPENISGGTNRAAGLNFEGASTGTVNIISSSPGASEVIVFASAPGTNQAYGLNAVTDVTVNMANGRIQSDLNVVGSSTGKCTAPATIGMGNFSGVNLAPANQDCTP